MNETGIGTRVTNFVTDTVLIFFAAWGFYKWWSFYAMYWQYRFIPFYTFFYAAVFVYYSVFEGIFSRTPGKYLSLSRVRTLSGGKPAFWQVLLRSALRLTLIDPFFIPFFNRPLHDILSKTKVMEM